MKSKVLRTVLLPIVMVALMVPLAATVGAQPTQEEVAAAITAGVGWLANQQNDDGFWPHPGAECAVTALAVKKLMHHAVDCEWGECLESPFDEGYEYKDEIENGLDWLFGVDPDGNSNCVGTIDISVQPAGDPDSDGDGIGVFWGPWDKTYTSGIMLMTLCEAVELDRVVGSGPLAGSTYSQVARDTMDYLAFGQNDAGSSGQGGWAYEENEDWGDNSNTGYATLGLGFAEAAPPEGCGFTIPQFVKNELNIWIDYIQNDVGPGDDPCWDAANTGDCDGGSGYTAPDDWVNILKTGNLLQQMALVGDTPTTGRVLDALDYMERHWNDANQDPGWRGDMGLDDDGDGSVDEDPWDGLDNDGDLLVDEDRGLPANYQAAFTSMKGFTALDIHVFGDPLIDWQADFETALLAEQLLSGSWPFTEWDYGEQPILSTTWALLTLQKIAPPPPTIELAVDIKPTSCPNPLNVDSNGVLPVAVLGTETFDVEQIDIELVQLSLVGVEPLRVAVEDVAAPVSDENVCTDCNDEIPEGCECTEAGPDGYLDLVMHFDRQQVVEALGGRDALLEDPGLKGYLSLELILTTEDEEELSGSDCVRIQANQKGGKKNGRR